MHAQFFCQSCASGLDRDTSESTRHAPRLSVAAALDRRHSRSRRDGPMASEEQQALFQRLDALIKADEHEDAVEVRAATLRCTRVAPRAASPCPS